jgi:hypothetical protein
MLLRIKLDKSLKGVFFLILNCLVLFATAPCSRIKAKFAPDQIVYFEPAGEEMSLVSRTNMYICKLSLQEYLTFLHNVIST